MGSRPLTQTKAAKGLLRRKNLLRIFAGLERRRVAIGELVDREVEGTALAVLVAIDRPAYAIKALGRKQFVMQRLLADIGRAIVIRLRHLFDSFGEDDTGVVGLGME